MFIKWINQDLEIDAYMEVRMMDDGWWMVIDR
jgi:hypothetical protein